MERSNFSRWGSLVAIVVVVAIMMAFATPFGSFVTSGAKSLLGGLKTTTDNALNGGNSGSDPTPITPLATAGLYASGSNYSELITPWEAMVESGAMVVTDGVVSLGTVPPDDLPEKNEYGFYYEALYVDNTGMGLVFYSDTSFDVYFDGAFAESVPAGMISYITEGINMSGNGMGIGVPSANGTSIAFDDAGVVFVLGDPYEIEGDLVLPDDGSVTSIKDSAFAGSENLTSVIIPDSVTNIGTSAFQGCANLTSVTIPADNTSSEDSVLSNKVRPLSLTKLSSTTPSDSEIIIGDSAFADCTSLASVEIGDTVAVIENNAFRGDRSLTSFVIPNNVTRIGESAFSGCENLSSVTIGESVTDIGKDAFGWCTALEEIHFNATAVNDLCANNGVFTFAGRDAAGVRVTVGANVTKIPAYLFYPTYDRPINITSVEFENGSNCISIEASAFEGCINLSSINIPDSTTTIAGSAFRFCSKLTSIAIPNGVESIGDYAFQCSALEEVTFDEGSQLTSIGKQAFNGTNITSIAIPDSVTTIGKSAFFSCDNLVSVALGSSVTSVYDIFGGCPLLAEIVVDPNNPVLHSSGNCVIETASNTLVAGCNNSVIPDYVTIVGDYAFDNCSGLTSIAIPDSVTTIGEYAFSYCANLVSVALGSGVENIGEAAFYSCKSLVNIELPDSITTIGTNAFGFTGLTAIIIPDGVTSISQSAFSYCYKLESVTLSATSIGKTAFDNCTSLTSITFRGTTNEWKNVSLGLRWNNSVPATTVTCSDGTVTLN